MPVRGPRVSWTFPSSTQNYRAWGQYMQREAERPGDPNPYFRNELQLASPGIGRGVLSGPIWGRAPIIDRQPYQPPSNPMQLLQGMFGVRPQAPTMNTTYAPPAVPAAPPNVLLASLKEFLQAGKEAIHINKLDPTFSKNLEAMFRAAPPNIRTEIFSGYRSPERQQQLWEGALKKYGSPEAARKWVAPPGHSFHNKGFAADLKYLSPDARKWVHANAERFGLHFPLSNEPWHIEQIGARTGKITSQAGSVVRKNSDPGAIKSLQTFLASAGFDPGGIDGKYGQRTEAAIRAFQASNGLIVDGKAGPETQKALHTALGTKLAQAYGNNYNTAYPSAQAPFDPLSGNSGRGIYTQPNQAPFDPLSGNSGRGLYTQVDPALGLGGNNPPAAPPNIGAALRPQSARTPLATAYPSPPQRMSAPTWPTAQQSRSLTAPTVPGVTPTPVQTTSFPGSSPRPVTTVPVSPPPNVIDQTLAGGAYRNPPSVSPSGIQRIDPSLPQLPSTWNAPKPVYNPLSSIVAPKPALPAPAYNPLSSIATRPPQTTPAAPPYDPLSSIAVRPPTVAAPPPAIVTAPPPVPPPVAPPPTITQLPTVPAAPPEEGPSLLQTLKQYVAPAVQAVKEVGNQAVKAGMGVYAGSGPVKRAEIAATGGGGAKAFWEAFNKGNPTEVQRAMASLRAAQLFQNPNALAAYSQAVMPAVYSGPGYNGSALRGSYGGGGSMYGGGASYGGGSGYSGWGGNGTGWGGGNISQGRGGGYSGNR